MNRARRLAAILPPILIKAARDFSTDHIPNVAASVTFYALLAIFPALSAVISLYGLFGDANAPRQAVAGLGGLLPEGAVSVITDDLQRLAAAPPSSLGLAFAVSVLVSLYSANAGMKAMIAGLTVAYEDQEKRGFVRLYLVSSAFTVAAVLVAVIAIALIVAEPAVMATPLFRWPIFLLAVISSLWTLYRFGPDQHEKRHRTAPGGLVAAVAWIAMSFGFSWYVAHFGHFNRTFGSLGAVAGFMTWIWLSVMVVLFGAELNAAVDDIAPKTRR